MKWKWIFEMNIYSQKKNYPAPSQFQIARNIAYVCTRLCVRYNRDVFRANHKLRGARTTHMAEEEAAVPSRLIAQSVMYTICLQTITTRARIAE